MIASWPQSNVAQSSLCSSTRQFPSKLDFLVTSFFVSTSGCFVIT
eukprot:CAMPEP_0177706266 /NCGR_PEP_ID=MMETSP0484_2-20121128/9135_1 /TAXON_ID=354590 /ORGANISM="Rhodomonas lens, Strain RHODO" /LENGTH=44 /DNA_ID= /DNA_START= /DNA_END= /DNA_ORIENTATION=